MTVPHGGLKISTEISRNSAAQDLRKVRQCSKSGDSLRAAAPSLTVLGDGVLGGRVERAFVGVTISYNVCPLQLNEGLRFLSLRPSFVCESHWAAVDRRYIFFGYNGFDIVGYDPCL